MYFYNNNYFTDFFVTDTHIKQNLPIVCILLHMK